MSDSIGGGAKRSLAVYAVLDRKEQKPFWMRLGTAFVNRDGSMTVALDAVPIGTNRLQIREPRAWEGREDARPGNGSGPALAEVAP